MFPYYSPAQQNYVSPYCGNAVVGRSFKIMEIVKFKDGKFGIRKRNFIQRLLNKGGVFKDFNPVLTHWRKPCDRYFKDCQMDSEQEVKEWLEKCKNDWVSGVV